MPCTTLVVPDEGTNRGGENTMSLDRNTALIAGVGLAAIGLISRRKNGSN